MILFIRRFDEFLRLGIAFFKRQDVLIKNINYLSLVIDNLIKEQVKLNKTIEEYKRFSMKVTTEDRREAAIKEQELKPTEYDLRY